MPITRKVKQSASITYRACRAERSRSGSLNAASSSSSSSSATFVHAHTHADPLFLSSFLLFWIPLVFLFVVSCFLFLLVAVSFSAHFSFFSYSFGRTSTMQPSALPSAPSASSSDSASSLFFLPFFLSFSAVMCEKRVRSARLAISAVMCVLQRRKKTRDKRSENKLRCAEGPEEHRIAREGRRVGRLALRSHDHAENIIRGGEARSEKSRAAE